MKKIELKLDYSNLLYLKGLLMTDYLFSKQLLEDDDFKDEDDRFLSLFSLKHSKFLYDTISSVLDDN